MTSITQPTFVAGGLTNLLLVGNEILRFRDATLIGEDTYKLSYFTRGLRSSAPTHHHSNERVVMLSELSAIALESDISGAYELRVLFDDQEIDTATSIPFIL